jgi:hypothetical protein
MSGEYQGTGAGARPSGALERATPAGPLAHSGALRPYFGPRFHPGMRLSNLLCASVLMACGSATSPFTGASGPVGYGVPTGGHPDYSERTVLALSNAMRMAPSDFKAKWAAGDLGSALGSAYPAVAPLRWNAELGDSAWAHSEDMATAPCFQHDSCNGTVWSTRIESYYTLSPDIGENIAAGYDGPDAVLFAWACDGSSGACAPDGNGDGHRANLMDGTWQAVGVGYFQGGSGPYGSYFTQDFGGKAAGVSPPLVDGSHDLVTGGTTRFFLNYDDAAAPQSVTLELDGAMIPIAVALGTAAAGSYAAEETSGTGCRSYAFLAVDASGTSWRYPASGSLRTYGEDGCSDDYEP